MKTYKMIIELECHSGILSVESNRWYFRQDGRGLKLMIAAPYRVHNIQIDGFGLNIFTHTNELRFKEWSDATLEFEKL